MYIKQALGAYGEKKVLNKKYLKKIYDKHVNKGGIKHGKKFS